MLVQKYNNSLFPSYASLADIKLELPAPPSRSKIARDVGDLWHIHVTEPHITQAEDPGIVVPLPDENGYNPTGLSETSGPNITINRDAVSISQEVAHKLYALIKNAYDELYTANCDFKNQTIADMKRDIKEQHPGTFYFYNGSNKNKMFQAYTLYLALDSATKKFIDDSELTSAESKAQILEFIKPYAPLRSALLLPDANIRQHIQTSTDSVDKIKDLLSDLKVSGGLSPNPSAHDPDFADNHLLVKDKALDLSLETNCFVQGVLLTQVGQGVLTHLCAHISNEAIRDKILACFNKISKISCDKIHQDAQAMLRICEELEQSLQDVAVDASYIKGFVHKKKNLTAKAHAKPFQFKCTPAHNAPNHSAADLLQHCLQQLESQRHNLSTKDMESAFECEYILSSCWLDICEAVRQGVDADYKIAFNCYQSLLSMLNATPNSTIKQKRDNFNKAVSSLESAKKTKALQGLKSAQEQNVISDTKVQMLTQML
jgi:oligoribonuclease (3'-5' exoribonuclease)